MYQEFNEFDCNGLDDVILKTEYYNKNVVDEILKLFCPSPLSNIDIEGKKIILKYDSKSRL